MLAATDVYEFSLSLALRQTNVQDKQTQNGVNFLPCHNKCNMKFTQKSKSPVSSPLPLAVSFLTATVSVIVPFLQHRILSNKPVSFNHGTHNIHPIF